MNFIICTMKTFLALAIMFSLRALAQEQVIGENKTNNILHLEITKPIIANLEPRGDSIILSRGSIRRGSIGYWPKYSECVFTNTLNSTRESPQAFISSPELAWKPGTVLNIINIFRYWNEASLILKISNSNSTSEYDAVIDCGGIYETTPFKEVIERINSALSGFAQLKN